MIFICILYVMFLPTTYSLSFLAKFLKNKKFVKKQKQNKKKKKSKKASPRYILLDHVDSVGKFLIFFFVFFFFLVQKTFLPLFKKRGPEHFFCCFFKNTAPCEYFPC